MTSNDTHTDRVLASGALPGRQLGLCRGLIDGGNALTVHCYRLTRRSEEALDAYLELWLSANAVACGVPSWTVSSTGRWLCPDQPLSLLAEPVSVTPQRRGSIPRTYIATLRDNAIAPAVQEILMNDADTLTSKNRFQRVPIDTGHSPFASRPAELAGILNSLGR